MTSEPCLVHKHRYVVPLDRHHIHPLGEGGPDTEANIITVCPNGHRRMHDYLRLLKKHNGEVPWIKRKFFGKRVQLWATVGWVRMTQPAVATFIEEVDDAAEGQG